MAHLKVFSSLYMPAALETQVSGPVLVTEKASSRCHRMKWGWNPQTVRGRSEEEWIEVTLKICCD